MLPTNSGQAKDKGCSPVSSNCVVWQGPDLDCIGVCRGDSISDVTEKMATELCTLMDLFDLSAYDLACLSIPTSDTPANFQGLTQILIDRICALEGLDPVTPTGTTGDCPDNCIVPIADCFYYINPQGDTVTTMTLTEYVTAIGNRICDIINDVTILQNEVDTLQTQINGTDTSPGARKAPTSTGLVGDIADLEANKASKSSLEYQVNAKTDPSAGVQFVTDALRYVENSLISTQDSVGSETAVYQNMLKAGLIDTEDKMFGTGEMNCIPGWTSSPQTAADSLGNLWLAVRDLRSQVDYMKENCCSTGCSDIWLNFRSSLNISLLTIYTDGSTGFTDDWAECTGTTKVTVTDALGNSATFTTSLLTLMGDPSGYSFDLAATSVDTSTDLKVVADTCFINTATDTTCNEKYEDIIINSAACPSVILTAYTTSINYQFAATSGFSYIANVYYSGSSTPVATQIIATPGVTVLNSILGLLSETAYDFELVVVNTLGTETPCPKQPFNTLADSCQPPINATALLTT